MRLLDRGKVGFRVEANGKPSEVYVSRVAEDSYGIALSVDHGNTYGKVHYILTNGGDPCQYATLELAESALFNFLDLPEGSSKDEILEEAKHKSANISIDEMWGIVSARPIQAFRLSDDEPDKVDWRERKSHSLLKRISSIV
jgi:hypothetical protein